MQSVVGAVIITIMVSRIIIDKVGLKHRKAWKSFSQTDRDALLSLVLDFTYDICNIYDTNNIFAERKYF